VLPFPRTPATAASLRQLLQDRFPEKARPSGGEILTGVAAIDEALGGGLPARRVTELVSAGPSTGGQSVLARLLASTRAARQRVALVDGADAFDPSCVAPDTLPHLVWVRIRGIGEALAAADILVRDGNYAAVAIDLRGIAATALRQVPATLWYRLQRATEDGVSAVLIQTEFPLISSAACRLLLPTPFSLDAAGCAPCARLAAELPAILNRTRGRAPIHGAPPHEEEAVA